MGRNDKRIEIRIAKSEQDKKDTMIQAFCKACNRGVNIPHKCPIDGVLIVKTRRSEGP